MNNISYTKIENIKNIEINKSKFNEFYFYYPIDMYLNTICMNFTNIKEIPTNDKISISKTDQYNILYECFYKSNVKFNIMFYLPENMELLLLLNIINFFIFEFKHKKILINNTWKIFNIKEN